MINEELIELLLQYIENERVVLDEIAKKLGVNCDDILYQFPESTNDLYLNPGEVYEKEIEISKKLHYISIDAPEGILITIYLDDMPRFFDIDAIGAIELQAGLSFSKLKIVTQNLSELKQKWNCRLICR